MDHAYFRDKVSAYHDRELPAQEQEMLAQHIAACPECQKLLADLERLDQVVVDNIELGQSDYWEQNARKIEAKLGFGQETVVTPVKQSSWERGMVWKLSAVAASVALLVFIGINWEEIRRGSDQVGVGEKLSREEAIPTEVKKNDDLSPVRVLDSSQQTKSQDKDAGQLIQQEEKRVKVKEAANRARAGESPAVQRKAEQVVDSNTQRLPVQPNVVIQKVAPPQPEEDEIRKQAVPAAAGSVESIGRDIATDQAGKIVAESVELTEGAASELVRWRTVRDSLKSIVERPKESMMSKYGVNALRTDTKKKGTAEPDTKAVAAAAPRYLESCFHVALLTGSPTEYNEAKRVLEAEAQSTDSLLAVTAKRYLERLIAERPTPPQK